MDLCGVRTNFLRGAIGSSDSVPNYIYSSQQEKRVDRMSQTSSEKFLYFTVGLLKGSDALEALRQDATRYHMIDHPGQLIALRLTEYYELINQGVIQPGTRGPAVKTSPEANATTGHEPTAPVETPVPQRPVPASFPSSVAPVTSVQASQPILAAQAQRSYP